MENCVFCAFLLDLYFGLILTAITAKKQMEDHTCHIGTPHSITAHWIVRHMEGTQCDMKIHYR